MYGWRQEGGTLGEDRKLGSEDLFLDALSMQACADALPKPVLLPQNIFGGSVDHGRVRGAARRVRCGSLCAAKSRVAC